MKADTKGDADGTNFSKSIVLVSSIAGITEAPGLFAYSAAKHGVIGMMRALRPWAPAKYGVRANAICPWATDTQLLAGVKARWVKEKMPLNQPVDVGRMIVQCAASGSLNGKAVFVAGGRGFDTEEGVERTQPQWMGQENSATFQRGQEILGLVGVQPGVCSLKIIFQRLILSCRGTIGQIILNNEHHILHVQCDSFPNYSENSDPTASTRGKRSSITRMRISRIPSSLCQVASQLW